MCFFCGDDGSSLFGLRKRRGTATFIASAVEDGPAPKPRFAASASEAGEGVTRTTDDARSIKRHAARPQ